MVPNRTPNRLPNNRSRNPATVRWQKMKASLTALYENAARKSEQAKYRNAIAAELGYHICDKHPEKQFIDYDELMTLLDQLEENK